MGREKKEAGKIEKMNKEQRPKKTHQNIQDDIFTIANGL